MAKRVALALGSGGARGYAYIGVVEEFRSRGYEVVGVAGSSMGALVGGLLAAGSLDEFAAWATTLTQRTMLRLLDASPLASTVSSFTRDLRVGGDAKLGLALVLPLYDLGTGRLRRG